MLMNAGEKASGGGGGSRGESLLGGEQRPGCAEKGLLLVPAALGALYAGHAGKALQLSEQAAAMGEQFGDVDLIALGQLGQGQAMLRQGEVAKGIKLREERMIRIETDEVHTRDRKRVVWGKRV